MRRTLGMIVLAALCVACGGYDVGPRKMDLTALCIAAVSEDAAEATRATTALRARGPEGLEALFSTYRAAVDRHRAEPTRAEPTWGRLATALDAVAAQKDAWAAGLYWYTDMDAARRAATESGKPILSLRLLGTLDTEFSCANSRFFRTVLYPNAQVGQALREGFVLHWQSHRPVPRLTIDYGDGRKIERTITGNSVHYVLTPDGRVVDAIPGLYGASAFLRATGVAAAVAREYQRPDFEQRVTAHHAARLERVRQAWADDLRTLGIEAPPRGSAPGAQGPGADAPQRAGGQPTAMAGTRIAGAKSQAEVRTVAALAPDRAALAGATDDAAWERLAARHAGLGRLDAGSRAVVRAKVGAAVPANAVTRSKAVVEDPVVRIVARFERSVAEDTVRNEYLLHTRVHEWFATGTAPASLDALNERVYAELFLMPSSDPWLGLVPEDAYTALPADAARR